MAGKRKDIDEQKSVTGNLQEFHDDVDRILKITLKCLEDGKPFEKFLNHEPDSIYIKTSDLTLVFSNLKFQEVFSGAKVATGRPTQSFLPETVVQVSKASDATIMAGCERVSLDHFGQDVSGRSVLFRTEKRSLIGYGHPGIAILGISRIQEILSEERQQVARRKLLSQIWLRFQQMSAKDQATCIALAQGQSPAEISKLEDVSKRTIEVRRKAILSAMHLESQIELTKALVRLQDDGFADFGM